MEFQDFSEFYKTISNSELLEILNNSDSYQPIALEAAKRELENRRLTDDDISEAKKVILDNEKRKEERSLARKQIEQKIKLSGDIFIDTINPIQSSPSSVEKKIRIVTIVFSIIFFVALIKNFKYLVDYLNDFNRYPILTTWTIFPFVILPVALITFWKRKTIGWVLFVIYLTFSLVETAIQLVQLISLKNKFSGFEKLFPTPAVTPILLELLFFGGSIYFLCQAEIKDIYSISKQTVAKALVMTSILTFLIYFFI
ncbi:MAG TPA: hypothetical protein VKT28_16075 [Puia sp.]|nr:hypothetical protein [Puia sp.]